MHRIYKALIMGLVAVFVLWVYLEYRVPAESLIAYFYKKNALTQTGAENAVAAIYLNYRVFDSLFETLMLIVSITAVINLSWRSAHEP